MLTSKWHTLNHNCQKFNAFFKQSVCLGKSGENDSDVIKRARATYQDENKGTLFVKEDAWEILRSHAKWDAPDLVDLIEGDVPAMGHEELFGEDARPRPSAPDKSTRPYKKANLIPRRAPGEVTRKTHFQSIYQSNFTPNRRTSSYKELIEPTPGLEIQRQRCATEEQEQPRNRYSLQSLLYSQPTTLPGARPGQPDFNLDADFKPLVPPSLALPTPEMITPPAPEINQQFTPAIAA
ncbi:hypothetical protein Tco_1057413 [Tanacetum coccineum]|uniref:No apical meristem-associated C-terminal domain-containing protein n=1 Tax=Tanacetum coccineum TaxID=301880 RepID=A0ABQ5H5J7_9ASTR